MELKLLFQDYRMLSMGKEKAINNSKTYSSHSFRTNQDSSVLCPSCKGTQEDLRNQISQLKEKAHQSFMQVLQIQQLHEEEISQMREEWEQKEQELQSLVSTLKEEVSTIRGEMQQLQKNVKRHNYDFGTKELVIDNIESIGCEDDDRSYLDESALIQFKELLSAKNANDYVTSLKREIYKDFKFISNNKTQIEKLFIVIKQLKDENCQLHKINELHKEKIFKTEAQLKEMKATIDSSHRQNKFISQNLKRLGNDKLNLQRKISELEKAKNHEEVLSPNGSRHKIGNNREDSSEKTDKMMEILHQVSELSLTTSRREINQLNYAKFMGPDEISGELSPNDFNIQKNTNQFKGSPTDFNIRRSPFRKMIN